MTVAFPPEEDAPWEASAGDGASTELHATKLNASRSFVAYG